MRISDWSSDVCSSDLAETIALVLHDADPAQFTAQLQRFVFRSKLAIESGAMEVGGAFEAHPAAKGARAAMAPDGFAFDFGGDDGARTLWAGPGLADRKSTRLNSSH